MICESITNVPSAIDPKYIKSEAISRGVSLYHIDKFFRARQIRGKSMAKRRNKWN